MCFSAEASFGAAAVLGVAGVISIKKASTFPQKVFAVIPLFFAIQQFIEGLLWLVLKNPAYSEWKLPLIIGFLLFAWLVWPVYIPFSMALFEKNKVRRKILLSFLVIGFLLVLCFLYMIIFQHPDANAAKLHIKYTFGYIPPLNWLWGIIYLFPTVVSMIISSAKKMWILGIINLCTYTFSIIYFKGTVLSVWCFFGALASIFVIWYIIRMNNISNHSEQNTGLAV
jgi:hypothetical protein